MSNGNSSVFDRPHDMDGDSMEASTSKIPNGTGSGPSSPTGRVTSTPQTPKGILKRGGSTSSENGRSQQSLVQEQPVLVGRSRTQTIVFADDTNTGKLVADVCEVDSYKNYNQNNYYQPGCQCVIL